MSAIVEASVPASDFGLETTFERLPETELRMANIVAHGSEQPVPFLWAETDDFDRLAEILREDSSVDSAAVLSEFEDNCLLHVRWASDERELPPIFGGDASLLDASAYDGEWQLQLFFPAEEEISGIYDVCEESAVEIEEVTQLSDRSDSGYFGLTDRQYQTVFKAYESGYYDVPRGINQEELADQLGVSHQAISERLRRAHETVITNGLDYRIYRGDYDVSPQVRHEVKP